MLRSLLLTLLVLPAVAHAQRARPFAEKGDLALVVGISPVSFPDITSAFDGIGLRYRATDRSVIGVSVGFDASTADRDGSGEGRKTASGRITVWNENHLGRGRGIVSPFVGGGLTASVRHESFDGGDIPCDPAGCPGPPPCDPAGCPGPPPCDPAGCPGVPGPVSATQSATFYSVGVGAILGAEVRVARGVTLGAAYTLGVAVGRTTYTADQPFGGPYGGPYGGGTVDDRTTVVAGGTGLTDLHLSVYF